ncbi:hypothetical protein ACFLUU_09075 [Chloroflexota bacterium]
MQKVYSHTEKQALSVYHSNEPWALRSWALSNILKEEVVGEVQSQIANEFISPVLEWQKECFDPISYFKDRLAIEHKSYRTLRGYTVTACRFVSKIGRKRHYSDEDVITYLSWANKNMTEATYYQ